MRFLAASAIVWSGASLYFPVFWRWFGFWRKHQLFTYAMMLGTLVAICVAMYVWRGLVFAVRVDFPVWVAAVGWAIIIAACALAFVADRQIGIRVRSFTPFFEPGARIELQTTGAYRLVRHPIYAAGIYYQLGMFLVTGYVAVAVACAVLAAGALWFTRQEERRLMELLDDPAGYERYRQRVGALFPRIRS